MCCYPRIRNVVLREDSASLQRRPTALQPIRVVRRGRCTTGNEADGLQPPRLSCSPVGRECPPCSGGRRRRRCQPRVDVTVCLPGQPEKCEEPPSNGSARCVLASRARLVWQPALPLSPCYFLHAICRRAISLEPLCRWIRAACWARYPATRRWRSLRRSWRRS